MRGEREYPDRPWVGIGVVAFDGLDVAHATAAVVTCARRLAASIGSDLDAGSTTKGEVDTPP